MIDFKQFEILTFECQGTLVDWESGILNSMQEILQPHGATAEDNAILERYAVFESAAESGPYIPYQEVLRSVMWQLGKNCNFIPKPEDDFAIANSIKDWHNFLNALQNCPVSREKKSST